MYVVHDKMMQSERHKTVKNSNTGKLAQIKIAYTAKKNTAKIFLNRSDALKKDRTE